MKALLLLLVLQAQAAPRSRGSVPTVPRPQSRPLDLGRQLDQVAADHGLVGLSVIGTKGDDVVVSHHTGQAEVTEDKPVTERTLFRVASISKVVSAIALLQQWEEGKFALDDDISAALGFEVRNPKHPQTPITYRHLFAHTSGLKDDRRYNQFLADTFSGDPPPLSAFKPTFTDKAPGEGYRYSNYGYGLIGTLVEKHSGKIFADYARERVLEPLGMEGGFTVAGLSHSALRRLAALYRWDGKKWAPQADDVRGQRPKPLIPKDYVPGHNAVVSAPHGGLRTTALGLSKLLRELKHGEGKVLKPGTLELLKTPEFVVSAARVLYATGLGLHYISPFGPHKGVWRGHAGDASGLHGDMYLHQDGPEGVVILTNGYKNGRLFVSAVLEAVLPKLK